MSYSLKSKPFLPGQISCTPGIATHFLAEAVVHRVYAGAPRLFLAVCLERHLKNDWGDVDAHDQIVNDEATHTGGRIISAYKIPVDHPLGASNSHGDDKIWIITEATNEAGQRWSTTILFPSEY